MAFNKNYHAIYIPQIVLKSINWVQLFHIEATMTIHIAD